MRRARWSTNITFWFRDKKRMCCRTNCSASLIRLANFKVRPLSTDELKGRLFGHRNQLHEVCHWA